MSPNKVLPDHSCRRTPKGVIIFAVARRSPLFAATQLKVMEKTNSGDVNGRLYKKYQK
jgi:hypothetical protein